ncbi:MAG TPA: hypothetical protein VKR30_03425 [Candidatus Limnocylindrales bacterium]|nr:hypothetical protein [Candidatus Limnocylindrales bacterium]
MARATTAWDQAVIGLALGATDGFLALEFPSLGLLVAVLAIVLFVRFRALVAGTGGLLFAGGVVWFVVLQGAVSRCASENDFLQGSCQMAGDVTPFVVGSLVVAATGLGLMGLAVRRQV